MSKDADGVLTVAGLTRDRDRRPGRHAGVRAGRGRPAGPGPRLRRRLRRLGRLLRRPSPSSAPRSPAGWPRRVSASTSAPAASWRWCCGPGSTCAGSVCTATTRASPSCAQALDGRRRSDHRRLLRRDRPAAARWPPSSASGRGCMVRVTTGVEAHTHEYIATAHEDQKFGFSIAGGQAAEALLACHDASGARPGRHPLPHRLADLRRRGLRGGRPADAAAARRVRRADRDRAARARPRRRLRHRLHQRRLTGHAGRAGHARCGEIIEHECAALGVAVPHLSIEPGRAISGPSTFALYEVGTVKPVAAGRRGQPALRRGGRRDERQHPHRPVRRGVLRHAGLAALRPRPPVLARVVGKHCEGGDILVRDEFLPADIAPGRPARRTGLRRVQPLDGQQLQPRAAAAGGRGPGRRDHDAGPARDASTTCCALDVG